ncbi:MAG TPA: pyruvate kinase, partial [Quisquiliibacterium sp.]|nr:pyruvate kinase [Quisquiliibacterium sp.]
MSTRAGEERRTLRPIIESLEALRALMLRRERACTHQLAGVSGEYAPSARNLAHYLALREQDLRGLQAQLARIGTSSLGRAEPDVLANLDRVLSILHRLAGEPPAPGFDEEPEGHETGQDLLRRHAAALLGPAPAGRPVRIMVTLPPEAAQDAGLVQSMVDAGMDVARINCAHDGPSQWQAMAAHVRQAARSAGREARILMDLAGPKLRTGPIAPGPAVLKLKPVRDAFGRVLAPALAGLRPTGSSTPVAGARLHLGVDPEWLACLAPGERVKFVDARGAHRSLSVIARDGDGVLAECGRTAYLTPDTRLERGRPAAGPGSSAVADLPRRPGSLLLRVGDRLRLVGSGTRTTDGEQAQPDVPGSPPAIACTLPEIFAQVRAGEPVWFDDGRIGAVIRSANADGLEAEVTRARPAGERLREDKGINLPESRLDLPALTAKDIGDIEVAARVADLVGLSFVQRAGDVEALRGRLALAGAAHVGILLKVETRRAFESLPALVFSAMAGPSAGIMIARGDLAVECGYERLAEVQEEILWAAEAAHMP